MIARIASVGKRKAAGETVLMNLDQIRELVGLMVENDLSRIEIQEGDTHILLRRGHPPVVAHAAMPMHAMPAPIAPPATPHAAHASSAAHASPPAAAPAESTAAAGNVIRSPMVGTFYAASDPDSPAFIKVGDTVSAETVVCLIEAMKVFNEIKAETSGRITRVLVSNGQAVEFDQPLFELA